MREMIIYETFMKYLIKNKLIFDVDVLLEQLMDSGVIDNREKLNITMRGLEEKAVLLFKTIMPLKDENDHQELVQILKNNNYWDLGEYLNRLIKNGGEEDVAPPPPALSTASRSASAGYHPVEHTNPVPRDDYSIQAYKSELLDYGIAAAVDDIFPMLGPFQINVQQMTNRPHDMEAAFGDAGNQYYDNFSRPQANKGLALVINNYDYGHLKWNRDGSKTDTQNMTKLLTQLEYDVVIKKDQKALEILDSVKEFVRKFKNADKGTYHSCVVVVMAHGHTRTNGHLQFIGTDWKCMDEERVLATVMECEDLARIPKIFIIQACRGRKYNTGVNVYDGGAPSMPSPLKSTIPVGADTCILHSTTPGFFSYRNTQDGSHFIQKICQEFADHAHKPWADLLTLATRVTNYVGRDVINATINEKILQVYQLPYTTTNMMKKFHFFPKYQQQNP